MKNRNKQATPLDVNQGSILSKINTPTLQLSLTQSCYMVLLKKGFLLLISFIAMAGAVAQKMRFHRYTVDDGLQNNIVFTTAEDAKGFTWFATSTGIDRFDGNNFVHYPLPVKNNGYMHYISVQSLLADDKKRIWAASGAHIYLYNSRKDVFELPAAINNWRGKNKVISGLYAGNGGRQLLIGASDGFHVYDHEKTQLISSEGFRGFVRFMYQDNKGIIWISDGSRVKRFVINNQKVSELVGSNFLSNTLEGAVIHISQDEQGRFWFGTLDGRLYVYDEASDVIQRVKPSAQSASPYTIKDVFHDRISHNTYVATDGGGLSIIAPDLSIIANYVSNEDDEGSLSNNAVYDVFVDDFKRLWITTYGGGVNLVNPTVQPFRNFLHEMNNANSLSNNAAKAVTEDQSGQLWFGTRKGISKWNPNTNQWTQYNQESTGLKSDNVLALIASNQDEIWVGTYGGGLASIHSKTKQVRSYLSTEKDTSTLGSDFVYAVLHDSKNRLWAGGIKGPLSYLDAQNNRFYRIKTPVGSIHCIIEDAAHDILVGTDKGLYRVAGDSMVNMFPNDLTSKVIYVVEDVPGTFWIGTLGKGLIHASKSKGILKVYETAQGLPSNVISGILKDQSGDLWIGTSMGVAHFQRAKQTFTYYTKADGLAGSQVNFGAVYSTSSKELVFGTTDGFSLFNPQRIRARGFAPKIVFTGITINNKKAVPTDEDSPLKAHLDELEEVTLQHFENSISIDFINTSPSVSGKHLYSWKLEGFDKGWSLPSTVPSAVYTNLGSGHYTLLVKAFSKGEDNPSFTRKLSIHIKTPWWLTVWAFIGYALLFSAGVLFLYNYLRIRHTRKKFADRLRLNTSISHEIRTPLTLIKGPVNALASVKGISDEQRENIHLAQKNILKLESIISQFIDYQKTGFDKQQMQVVNEDILPLLDDVVASFRPLMKEKNQHFTYHRPSGKLIMLFDREKMEKVINNLLSNAVKYTPPGKDILVDIVSEGKNLIVHVTDTGIGIPQEQQHFIFKGYFRADNTINIKETGSGIGLNLAKELVELHHGKLSFTSAPQKGTTFTVKLPLHNPALQQYVVTAKTPAELLPIPATNGQADTARPLNKTLVIAEDNDALRNYLQEQLTLNGCKVIAAADGQEAWELVQKYLPDMVITDVMMPHQNGFQLCLNIKRNLSTSHIPVIMLTAIHDKDYLLEGYRSGADDYVKKPFDLPYLLVRMENLLLNRIRFRNKIMSVFEEQAGGVVVDEEVTWLKTVTEIILENLTNPDFSVEKLSSMMAMSRPVLFRKFKAIANESPQQFITKVRVRKAVELLNKGKMNINEVAFECGFADAKYFSTHFKQHFGKTPSEYLKESAASKKEVVNNKID